jgi:hypothetical protein
MKGGAEATTRTKALREAGISDFTKAKWVEISLRGSSQIAAHGAAAP